MTQRVIVISKVKCLAIRSRRETECEKREELVAIDPKPRRSIHEQVETTVTGRGGPNPLVLKNQGMICGSE